MNPQENQFGQAPQVTPTTPTEPATPIAGPAEAPSMASEPTPAPRVGQPEANTTPNATPSEPITTPSMAPTGPVANTFGSQAVTAGKKGISAGAVVLVVIIILLLLGLGGFGIYKLISSRYDSKANDETSINNGDKKDKTDSTDGTDNNGGSSSDISNADAYDNEITRASQKMKTELDSFAYTATLSVNAQYVSFDTVMECSYDSKSQIEHCLTDIMGMSQEQYWDWANGYSYTRMDTGFSYGSADWSKLAIPDGQSNWIGAADYIQVESSEAKDGGTLYKGKVDSSKLGNAATGINGAPESGLIDITALVNAQGYIDNMAMTMDTTAGDLSTTMDITIQYKDFGTAPALTIPAEALNATE